MEIEERFEIPCPSCGGTQFRIPDGADDDSLIECDQCGLVASLQDLREHGLELAKDHVIEEAKAHLKKTLGKFFK